MHSVATWFLMGQPLEVVQAHLGPALKHQYNADKQTDFYLHSPHYLEAVFPIAIAGIISALRQDRCVALRIIFDRQAPGYEQFSYTPAIAAALFAKVAGSAAVDWQPLETTTTGDQQHHVYCLGHNIATTWETAGASGILAGDIIVHFERRCSSDKSSPIAHDLPAASAAVADDAALAIAPAAVTTTTLPTSQSFPDVADNLYEAEIYKAANTYRLVMGYEDGTFQPGRAVTREQAVTLLLRAIALLLADPRAIVLPDEITTAPFADVPITHRSIRQFYAAKQVGMLSGDEQHRAQPDATLTRAGLMAMMRRSLQVVVQANYQPGIAIGDVVQAIAPPLDYTDIDGHWGAPAIRELTLYGIATPQGESDLAFAPNAAAQRDFTAAALVRLVEVEFQRMPQLETTPTAVSTFPDIGSNPYKEKIIKAANDYGIVAGYDDGKFHPTDKLSREQAVTLLINAMQYRLPPEAMPIPETLSTPPPFADVTTGAAATKIQFAKAANLISGDGSGLFRPLDQVSRAALMAMIHKGLSYIVRHEKGAGVTLPAAIAPIAEPPKPFSDLSAEHWASDLIAELLPTGIVSPDLSDPKTYRFNPDQPVQRDYAAAAMVGLVETPLLDAPIAQPDHPLHDPDPEPAVTFKDVRGNRYEPQISIAANQYGIVSGFSDGTLRPTAPVSREQAVSMLIDALRERIIYESAVDIPATLTAPPFVDVPVDRWSAPKLYFAKQAGIIVGDATGRFFPEASVGRAQLMAIAYQALGFGVWQDFGRQISLDQVFNTHMVNTYNFVDIPDDHWAASIMPVMSILGLAQPQDLAAPERFAPNAIAQRDYTVATAVHMVQLMYTDTPTPVVPEGASLDSAAS